MGKVTLDSDGEVNGLSVSPSAQFWVTTSPVLLGRELAAVHLQPKQTWTKIWMELKICNIISLSQKPKPSPAENWESILYSWPDFLFL